MKEKRKNTYITKIRFFTVRISFFCMQLMYDIVELFFGSVYSCELSNRSVFFDRNSQFWTKVWHFYSHNIMNVYFSFFFVLRNLKMPCRKMYKCVTRYSKFRLNRIWLCLPSWPHTHILMLNQILRTQFGIPGRTFQHRPTSSLATF